MEQSPTVEIFRKAGREPSVESHHAMFEHMEEIFLRLSAQFPRNPRFQSMLDAARAAKSRTRDMAAAMEAKDMALLTELRREVRRIISSEAGMAEWSRAH